MAGQIVRGCAGGIALAVVVGIAVVPPDATASARHHSTESGSGNTQHENFLNSESCVGTASCEAVGTFYLGHRNGRADYLAEGWDGTGWTVQNVPNDDIKGASSAFSDVSCISASSCTAVGTNSISGGLAEAWDGTSWSAEAISAAELGLNGVSCVPGTSFCMAVGSKEAGRFGPVSLAWNGSSWTSETVASPGQYGLAWLERVSCLAPTWCLAVGGWTGTAGDFNLAELWNGTSWSVMDTPETGQDQSFNDLSTISCSSEDWCAATVQGGGFAQTWDGSTWSLESIASPSGATAAQLGAVWCASSTSCLAVGQDSLANTSSFLAETWDGNNWSIQSTTNPAYYSISLQGLSCSAVTSCVAVGQYRAKQKDPTTGISEILGPSGWSAEPTPPVTPVAVTPDAGPPKQAVSISLFAFTPGSTVTVAYSVRTNGARIELCTGTVAADGSFSCEARIPKTSRAGQDGSHEIIASGDGLNTSTTFTLT